MEMTNHRTFDPVRAHYAARLCALTDPLGGLGFRRTDVRVERERQARRAVFVATFASLVGAFAAIALGAAPAEEGPAAPPPPRAGPTAIQPGTQPVIAPETNAGAAARIEPPAVQVAQPAMPTRPVHVRTRAS